MLRVSTLLAAAVMAVGVTTHAQEVAGARERVGQRETPQVAVPRVAVPRAEAPRPAEPARRAEPEQRAEPKQRAEPERRTRPVLRPRPAPRSEPSPRVRPEPPQVEPPASATADQGRAVPRGSRPRGDNPPVGTAVPRSAPQRPRIVDRRGRVPDRTRTIVVSPRRVYNYYSYPRRYYPYGYGAFGLGYFYYDPYRWYPRTYSVFGGFYGGGFNGGVWRSGRYLDAAFDIGELRLRVRPRHAQVFVDGYYAGIIDDYDGIFQSLRMESGPYHIQLVAPGYEPLEFDVRIIPGQKITYRGDLLPALLP